MKLEKKDNTAAVMQPYLLPYIGYFQLIAAVDIFVIFDDVNYINRGWISRNRILLDGRDHFFTIPLSKASQNKLINEIEISEEISTSSRKILEQIKHGYKKAPSFEAVFPILEKIFLNKDRNLVQYIIYATKQICDYLDIDFNYKISSLIEKKNDFKGQLKIIEICKALGVKNYINPIGGTEIYDKNYFVDSGIDLKFIKTNQITYRQFTDNFVPHLSIIDLLMFNSKEAAKNFVKNYDLI